MAPKQSRNEGVADLALRQQLTEMKGVPLEQVVHPGEITPHERAER